MAASTVSQSRLSVPYTDFPAQFESQRSEILESLERVLRRGDFILGREVEEFEFEFAQFCGVKHAVGVASGTDALILSLRALGIGPGDEVLTVPNSWISSASSIVLVGAKPVFVDVGNDFLMDPAKIEGAITSRTKGIMPVHLTGRCADMEAIGSIAKRHGLIVLEDAAQAVGASRNGRRAGAFGAAGCFSLHPLKNLSGVGDGGIVTTHDDSLAARIRLLRNHGLKNRDEVAEWGFNSRLDTLSAAVLRCRLRQLSTVTEERRRNAAFYREKLSSVVTCPQENSLEYAIYHLFMIQCDRRDQLKQFLWEKGIDTRIHYPTPIHLQPCSSNLECRKGAFPVAEAQAQRILSLPVHSALTMEQLDLVSNCVLEFSRSHQ